VVTDLSEVVGRIWEWEARGVYLAVHIEPDCDPGIVLGILHADRLGPEDHAWLNAHREFVTASVAALAELRVQ
jgi:hypothetical protein